MAQSLVQTVFVVALAYVSEVWAHGRLVEPPGRSTMWRFGFDNPANYDDNALFCGGKSVQWDQNDGKCGVCGDNYKGPWHNEPGGKYANGIIVRKYKPGQLIEVGVHLTANHKGWFEFRLCRNDDPKARVQQSCFDEHLLKDSAGISRFEITLGMEVVKKQLKLPNTIRCKNCVLQWRYNTGNSWGVDADTKKGCVGCGPQEQFYGCADVAIGADDVKTGNTDTPVEVPAGDVDERDWKSMPDSCSCPLMSASVPVTSSLVGKLVAAAVFVIFKFV